MPDPKEHGLLFKPAMIHALLAGCKTATRRPITRHNSVDACTGKMPTARLWEALDWTGEHSGQKPHATRDGLLCLVTEARIVEVLMPRIAAGDLVYAREQFRCRRDQDDQSPNEILRRRPNACPWYNADGLNAQPSGCGGGAGKLRPAIHLPRQWSRIWRQVGTVYPQRIGESTWLHAASEGLACLSKDQGRTFKYGLADSDGLPGNDDCGWPWHEWEQDPRDAFRKLWTSIHGGWDPDAWVWAYDEMTTIEPDVEKAV